MSAPTATWPQAIVKNKVPVFRYRRFYDSFAVNVPCKIFRPNIVHSVLQSSENEWLSPPEILHEIKRQNLKEICSSAPICSVKKILYRTNGPFLWDKIKHVFALKSRVDDKVNGQPETPQVEKNVVVEREAVTKKEEKAIKNNKLSKEENKQTEGEDAKSILQCYYTPCGYVVTVDPDNNNLTKRNNKSSSKLMPSPIRCAFPVRLLQSTTTKSSQSKSSKPSGHVAKDNNAVPVIEYDTLFDTTGDTCVAMLDKFRPRIVDPYEYDPSQSRESAQSEDSKDMEGSSRGEGDEVDKSGKNVKKTLPSASKLKRSAEKRKLSEDSNLTSVNIKSLLTMENFAKLSKDSKEKIVRLLPPIDRIDEYTPTSSAFTNTFFSSACRQWQQLLQSGQLSISQRAKQKLEEASRNKVVDEWKKQHFEEELSEDTPPQDPRSKLFYPVPLNAAHQCVLDCVKRVCQGTQDADTSSLPTTSTSIIDEEVADQLSEQENKPPNCGSPEHCNESHETNGEPLSESDHEENKFELIDGKENGELSLELSNNSSEKDSNPDNGEIPEQRVSISLKLSSEKLPEQNKKSPGRLSVQNNKLLGRSCEQVDQSHDQNYLLPVDKGKQVEQDGRLLKRSLEQEFEKASLSLKLQINKLCQQELFRQLELFNKSAEQQGSRSPEGLTNAELSNSCTDSNRYKKKIKPCLKSPMNKFGQPSTATEASGKVCDINMCLTNTPSFANHVSQSPFSLFKTPSTNNHLSQSPFSVFKTPPLFGLQMPPKSETGVKRKSPSIIPSNTKKVCNNTRADFLTVLPAAYMYRDVLAELKRSSVNTSKIYTLPKRVGKQPRTDWQLLHSIYHDHTYATDYVPLSSTTSQEQVNTSCDNCTGEPMLICENCKRCVHYWCSVPGCSFCNDCLYVLPLV